MFDDIQVILWDFDGVILDSVPIRDEGYRKVLKDYPNKHVERLLEFQNINGGLSRYVKFRYFYEEILREKITDNKIKKFADKYSDYMVANLINPNLLIKDTLEFIQTNYKKISMHIVSGSDQNELRYLCSKLQIDHYFKSINGSPTPKITLVNKILSQYKYQRNRIVLIGDSINDFDAAYLNNIKFYGYNNRSINKKGQGYITTFS